MLNTYRPSGKFNPLLFAAAPVLVAASIVAGVAYQFVVDIIPYIYVVVLATIALGFGLKWTVAQTVKFTRCRNLPIAAVLALLLAAGAVAGGFGWGYESTLNAIIEEENIAPAEHALLREDFPFQAYIDYRVEAGWTFGRSSGAPVTGIFVYLFWLIEAGIIAGCALWGARESVAVPYCEKTDAWADKTRLTTQFPKPSPALLKRVEAAQCVDDLIEIDTLSGNPGSEALYYRVVSPQDESGTLFLIVSHRTDGGGKKEKTKTIHGGIPIDRDQLARLEALRDRRPGSPDASPAAPEPADQLADLASASLDTDEPRD